ncbi:chorismate--pyruvate lyase family protein [Shewanella sp. YIC-542]|uniref:chorismate--pyruvate lyase family protein n=1 Tax=Shewanella mytili TaxID=3377111 RepID=UPI00398F7227
MNLTSSGFPFGDIIQWVAPCQLPEPGQCQRQWLALPGSLTRHLRRHGTRFEVHVLGEAVLAPLAGEWPEPCAQLWVREVLLCLDNRPWVYARTLAPTALAQQQLLQLGKRPLGELLFTGDDFIAGDTEWAKAPENGHIRHLSNVLGQLSSQPIYGRRRHFHYHGQRLIVAEFFLPEAVKQPPLAMTATTA